MNQIRHDENWPGNGLAIVQSNRPQELRQLVVDHLRRHPLGPLEDEVILTQSNGIGRWLQLAMAENVGGEGEGGGLGISASARFELPARFLWDAYRLVLGTDRLPEQSLFDANQLRWLVYRLVERHSQQRGFEAIAHFLEVDRSNPRRRFQLAAAIADLFESYQFFRADWLSDWEDGDDRLRVSRQRWEDLPSEQAWQPEFWRALVETAGESGVQHRGRLHRDFIDALNRPFGSFPELPRRVIVFGISSLPEQVLQALAALSKHAQVLVCLHNPCRWYWGNIVEARDDYRRWSDRHPLKHGMPDKQLADAEIDQWANPLLASWGKQGRDFINLLDEMDRPEDYSHWFDDPIDLFVDFADPDARKDSPLLHQLQQGILDLEPSPPAEKRQPIASEDTSIRFTVAHSRQREVEILHDRLLAAFAADGTLQPRDIIVMVPDIDEYAPHIEAVFGNHAGLDAERRPDERYIPYTVGDRNERVRSGFLRAIEELLALPQSRFTSAEVLDLLHVPALRQRFGLDESEIELAAQWLEGAGVRWGLDGGHRKELLEDRQGFEQNSWRFGLDRMMLGYASGGSEEFAGVLPYDEVSVGSADLAAKLAALAQSLHQWRSRLAEAATVDEWVKRLRALVDDFLLSDESEDAIARHRFDQALEALATATAQAGLKEEELPLEIVRDTLVAELDRNSVSKRFLAGRVNFSTLMPMRAIPFRMVCLLGMNDGDYPRTRKPADFDLMDRFRRPGDRTRRDDDRYLFLEALLSAGEQLHVSWVGRSIRDNSAMPPSVLVGQLRDAITAGWVLKDPKSRTGEDGEPGDAGEGLVEHLTSEHPLQPFSRGYFDRDRHELFTYAREWGELWQPESRSSNEESDSDSSSRLPIQWPEGPVSLRQISDFFTQPVRAFMRHRLRVSLAKRSDVSPPPVDEPFGFDGLGAWKLKDELLQSMVASGADEDARTCLDGQRHRFALEGRLPVAPFDEVSVLPMLETAAEIGQRYLGIRETLPGKCDPLRVDFSCTVSLAGEQHDVRLQDWVGGLRQDADGRPVLLQLTASKLISTGAKSVTRDNARWDKLAGHWPAHLAACAMGQPLTTIVVGEGLEARFDPVDPEQAAGWLAELIEYWVIGMSRPLPATPALSGRYLKELHKNQGVDENEWIGKTRESLRASYEEEQGFGNNKRPAERDMNVELARFYPDFSSLWEGGKGDDFRAWSERIYTPLVLNW